MRAVCDRSCYGVKVNQTDQLVSKHFQGAECGQDAVGNDPAFYHIRPSLAFLSACNYVQGLKNMPVLGNQNVFASKH